MCPDAQNATNGQSVSYVVSADIRSLLTEWAEAKGFKVPEEGFFKELRAKFSEYMGSIFPSFVLLEEGMLFAEMESMLSTCDSRLPVISLDRSYWRSPYSLELTRAVRPTGHRKWEDVGQCPRAGFSSMDEQIRSIAARVQGEAVLVDDVIFEGKSMEQAIVALKRAGIQVSVACVAVGIGPGVAHIDSLVGDVRCGRFYSEVKDEVCERDFYPGVPFSGRSVAGTHNTGAPYLYPFGDPVRWASLPEEKADEFSVFCREQTAALFIEIERKSEKIVRCSDLPRDVYLLPRGKERFVDELKRCV